MSSTGITISSTLFMMQPLSDAEKELREWFVREYIFDYNAVQAAYRIGFQAPFATEYAKQFMNEAYVQSAIRRHQIAKSSNEAEEKEQLERQVQTSLVREANFHGADSSHGARVSALGKLVTILGMEAAKKTEVDVNHRGGVMIIPAIANVEDWEKEAMESQGELIDASRID